MSAKRPSKRYFVERTSDRCSVYFEENGQRNFLVEDEDEEQLVTLGRRSP